MAASYGHVPSLDGLRAASIAIVLAAHLINPALPGRFGVTVFFFISGFLITRLLYAELKESGRISLGNFYVRRFLRLYPAIIAFVLIFNGLLLILNKPTDPLGMVSILFYFANYLIVWRDVHGIDTNLYLVVFWSLSVEEHFYFLMPAVFLLASGKVRALAAAMILVCVGSLLLRIGYALAWPETIGTQYMYMRSETRFDSIAYGVLLAVACESPRGRHLLKQINNGWFIAAAGAALVFTFVYRNPFFLDAVRYSIQGMALFVFVNCVVFGSKLYYLNVILNSWAANWCGRLSYSLYVWHVGVAYLSEPLVKTFPPVFQGAVLIVLSFIVASLSYFVIERPCQKLRRGFRPALHRQQGWPALAPTGSKS